MLDKDESRLIEAVMGLAEGQGQLRGEVSSMKDVLHTMSGHLEVIRQSCEDHGTSIGLLQQADRVRKKQISDLYRGLGRTMESTQEILLVEAAKRGEREGLFKVGKAAVVGVKLLLALAAGLGVGGGVFAAFQAIFK